MDDRRNASLSTEISDSPQESGATAPDRNPLNREAILSHLGTRIIGSRLILLDEIDSTNSYLQRLPENELSEGTVVTAEYQTAGRGRHGRTWVAPPRANLLFSVVIAPPDRPLGLVTLAGAVSVVEALLERGMEVSVKWPNDVVSEDRKIAGVLCETRALYGGGSMLILGIGINVNLKSTDLPEDLRANATSTLELLGFYLDRNELLAAVLKELDGRLEELMRGEAAPLLATARRQCSTLGRDIQVAQGNNILEGTAVDLDESGGLVLRMADGSLRVAEMGEVR